MKRLILMMSLVVGIITQLFAQSTFPCDITSSGIELRNTLGNPIPSISTTGGGIAKFTVRNEGGGDPVSGSPCEYAVGKVRVQVNFIPSTWASYYFKYDGGPLPFNSGKYIWTYNTAFDQLIGFNTVPIPSNFSGAEIVNVPIAGVAVGTTTLAGSMSILVGTSGDNTSNNSFNMPVTVVAGVVVPITLTDFQGKSESCVTSIKWTTTNEINLKRYDIETSTDGATFTFAGSVKPSVTNTDGIYQFNWNQGNGKMYYRLKIIDNNGSYNYSKIIPVSAVCDEKKFVKLYPNPVIINQILKVIITGYDTSAKGDLYAANGQLIRSFVLKNGTNNLAIENLAQGFYTFKVSENGTITEAFKLSVLK
jgi:hypothetical protein